MEDKEKLISIGEAAEYLGVSIDTLRRWEKKGKVTTYRSPGGHRYFKPEDLDKVFGKKYERDGTAKPEPDEEKEADETPEQEEKTDEDIEPASQEDEAAILNRPVRPVQVPRSEPVRIMRQQRLRLIIIIVNHKLLD